MNEVRNLPIICVFLHSYYRYYVPLRLPPIRNTLLPSLYAFFLPFGDGQGLSSSEPHFSYIPFPLYRGILPCCFSSFFTRSMVFAHYARTQLPFVLFRDLFFNDTAEFTLCYGLHDCSLPYRVTLSTRLAPCITATHRVWLHGSLAITVTGLTPASVVQLRWTHTQ